MMKAFQPTHSTSHTAYCRHRAGRSGHGAAWHREHPPRPPAARLPPPLNGTHQDEVFGSVLDGPEDAQDDSHDV